MNEITDNRTKKTNFQNLLTGDCFCWEGSFYMITEDGHDCINLENGDVLKFDYKDEVEKVIVKISVHGR